MDIFTIRQQLRTTRLSDIPLRVTFYARVSTDSDEQLNSLDNQIGYYRDYITRNPGPGRSSTAISTKVCPA